MENMARITLALPQIKPANVEYNAKKILKTVREAYAKNPHIIAFPAYCLTGASCGFMFKSKNVIADIAEAVRFIADETAKLDSFIIIGLPDAQGNSAAVVIHKGEIIRYIDENSQDDALKYRNLAFTVKLGGGKTLIGSSCSDANLVICLSANSAKIGMRKKEREFYNSYSRANGVAVAAVNGNYGETTSPYLYDPFAMVFESGELLSQTSDDEKIITADIDLDIIGTENMKCFNTNLLQSTDKISTQSGFLRNPKCNPFLPTDLVRRRLALDEMFDFQVKSLTGRMQSSGIKKLVLGVSGGLDSTLALMVAVKALDDLELPRTNLIGVTMPGFGTNDRTYYNALKLIVGFKAQMREISIKDAVLQHFSDIGHDADIHNSTYENAQARERAQILLDIANTENALVVGTGDMSEIALGFFTYSGDQAAHFNVNQSLPKTVIREVINRQMTLSPFEPEADLLSDIVLTPISPELLPSETEFAQQTEMIIGSYELHDFFLYYYVKYGFDPQKLYKYAVHSFFGIYDKEEILRTIKIFFKRLISNQFKRSFNPDGANFGEISLGIKDFSFPSDMDSKEILDKLESIN